MIFPAHSIVQRMGSGIAPVMVEVEVRLDGGRARQREVYAAGIDGELRCQNLGCGHGKACRNHGLLGRLRLSCVDPVAGAFQQRLCRLRPNGDFADLGDGQRIILSARDSAIYPGPRFGAQEIQRLGECGAGYAEIDSGVNVLTDKPIVAGRSNTRC